MKKQRSKPTKSKKSHASFSRTELAAKLGVDVRTIDRRCGVLGVKASKRLPGKAITYRLTPGQVDLLHRRLDHGQLSQPPSDLKRAKLAEEIELLRLKNKKLREENSPNWLIAQILKDLAETVPAILENHLETYAIQGANKEPAELRSLGKSTNDTIRAEVHSFLQAWSAKWDTLASESRETA
jgi:hypothetical protein